MNREIRECLKLDPDHKQCFPFYKKVKKLVKQMDQAQQQKNDKQWDDCISKGRNMLKTEGRLMHYVHTAKGYICHCQAQVIVVSVEASILDSISGLLSWLNVLSRDDTREATTSNTRLKGWYKYISDFNTTEVMKTCTFLCLCTLGSIDWSVVSRRYSAFVCDIPIDRRMSGITCYFTKMVFI